MSNSTLGKYKIPRPFQDEDKWFRFFTKKQLAYIGVALLILIRFGFWVKDAKSIVQVPILTIGCFLVITVTLFGMFTMPTDRYLWGGGITLERLIVRVVRKKIKGNRVLYVKGYKVEEPEKEKKVGKVGELLGRGSSNK